jgi:Spy/CpxP family protein refolding chaperone
MNKQFCARRNFYTLCVAAAAMWLTAPVLQADPMHPGEHGMDMSHHGGYEEHGMHGHYGHGGYMYEPHNAAIHFIMMAHVLGLSHDQVQKLMKLRDDYIQDNSVAENQVKAAHMDLQWLLKSSITGAKFDRDDIDKKLAEIGKLESGLWKSYVDQLQAINSLLTPEQKDRLKRMESPHGAMRGHGGAMMHGPKMGGPKMKMNMDEGY